MNSRLKLIVVAITSFGLGVAATMYFNNSGLVDPVLTPRQKELQALAVEVQNRPFFLPEKDTSNQKVAAPISSEQ